MIDLFLFNAMIWCGGIALFCLVSAFVNDPIACAIAAIFVFAMLAGLLWLYLKSVEAFTKPDGIVEAKDGHNKYVLKGNGHEVCLTEYYEGRYWTYDCVDKKYIRPTEYTESYFGQWKGYFHSRDIKDYQDMLGANSNRKKLWKEYREQREYVDNNHYQMLARKFGNLTGSDYTNFDTLIYQACGECTVNTILEGKKNHHYYDRYNQPEYDRVEEGRKIIEDTIASYKKLLDEYDVYKEEIPTL